MRIRVMVVVPTVVLSWIVESPRPEKIEVGTESARGLLSLRSVYPWRHRKKSLSSKG